MQTKIIMGRSQSLLTAGFILILIGFSMADIISDLSEGATYSHIILESVVVTIGLTALVWIGLQVRATREASAELTKKLAMARQEAAEWRERSQGLLRGLGQAIDEQLRRWNLTAAEREVAVFLLKGYSMKDISGFRNTSERTCRQQAADIYRKSGLGGRAEFSAFFLEDLLLPMDSSGQ